MSIKKLKNNNIYNNLQKNKKNLIKFSLLVVLLGVTVNAFAWLSSNNVATVETEADVSSWIVRFTDSDTDEEIKEATYNVWMQPGMADFEENITASNEGTTDATVTVEVTKLSILGSDVNLNQNGVLDKFPFVFNLGTGEIVLQSGHTTEFSTSVSWTYEDDQYFPADDYYGFQEDFTYYTKNGSDYEEAEVTASTYPSLKSTLYVYKDDLDTYFGEQCGVYQNSTSKPCITFTMKYIATQVEP